MKGKTAPIPKGARPIQVDPEELAKMQRGYEERLKRQSESITRLLALLEERTDQISALMRAENERAGQEAPEHVPMNVAPEEYVALHHIAQSWGLDQWDGFDPHATPLTNCDGYIRYLRGLILDEDANWGAVLAAVPSSHETPESMEDGPDIVLHYMRHLGAEVAHQKSKQGALVRDLDEFGKWLDHNCPSAPPHHTPISRAKLIIRQMKTDLAAVTQHANRPVVVDADDTPPWERNTSMVVPTVVERHTPMDVPSGMPDDTETLSFDGFSKNVLPDGEVKPGSF